MALFYVLYFDYYEKTKLCVDWLWNGAVTAFVISDWLVRKYAIRGASVSYLIAVTVLLTIFVLFMIYNLWRGEKGKWKINIHLLFVHIKKVAFFGRMYRVFKEPVD